MSILEPSTSRFALSMPFSTTKHVAVQFPGKHEPCSDGLAHGSQDWLIDPRTFSVPRLFHAEMLENPDWEREYIIAYHCIYPKLQLTMDTTHTRLTMNGKEDMVD